MPEAFAIYTQQRARTQTQEYVRRKQIAKHGQSQARSPTVSCLPENEKLTATSQSGRNFSQSINCPHCAAYCRLLSPRAARAEVCVCVLAQVVVYAGVMSRV